MHMSNNIKHNYYADRTSDLSGSLPKLLSRECSVRQHTFTYSSYSSYNVGAWCIITEKPKTETHQMGSNKRRLILVQIYSRWRLLPLRPYLVLVEGNAYRKCGDSDKWKIVLKKVLGSRTLWGFKDDYVLFFYLAVSRCISELECQPAGEKKNWMCQLKSTQELFHFDFMLDTSILKLKASAVFPFLVVFFTVG